MDDEPPAWERHRGVSRCIRGPFRKINENVR
jgi:hypothetical protein